MNKKTKKTDQEKVNKHLDNMVRKSTKVSVLSILPSHLFEEIRPPEIPQERWKNVCQWIVDSLLRGIKNERVKEDNYVAMSSIKFKKILGNKYKLYLDTLIDSGILECDGQYSIKSGESLGYRIHHSYLGGQIGHRTLKEKSLLVSIRNYQKKLVAELKSQSVNLLPFTRWLTTDSIVLDKVKAMEYLATYMGKIEEKVLEEDPSLIKHDKLLKFLELRQRMLKEGIKHWSICRSFTVDHSGGRLHTPLTNMPSILRNFLTTREGEPLVSIDIRNSQPFHLVCMFQMDFWKRKSKGASLYNLDKELYDHIEPRLSGKSSLIKFPGLATTLDIAGFQQGEFMRQIQNGTLYEFMSDEFMRKSELENVEKYFGTRERTKRTFLNMMYFDPNKGNVPMKAIFKKFAELFPAESKIMKLLKSRDYRDFPIMLQKIEVDILLKKVGAEVYRHSREIPLYSIHDSLVTTVSNLNVVRDIVNQVYEKELGFRPSLKVEYWNEQSAMDDLPKYVDRKLEESGIFKRVNKKKSSKSSASAQTDHDSEGLNLQELIKKLFHVDEVHAIGASTDLISGNVPIVSTVVREVYIDEEELKTFQTFTKSTVF